MSFIATLVYLVLTYLSPADMMPAITWIKPMWIVSFFGLVAMVLSFPENRIAWRTPQVLLLAAFAGMIAISRGLNGWLGGMPVALLTFLPAAMCFYLTIGTVDTPRKIRIIIAGLFFVGLYFNTMSILARLGIIDDPRFVLEQFMALDMETLTRDSFLRTRAVGFMADPNDFAQFLLVLIPLAWLWKGNIFWNFVTIHAPCLYLLFGVFLTRSRGALLGLSVVVLLVVRRKVGNFASGIITGVMFIGLLAIGFTGGRGVSVASGSDRLALWSDGLGMLKSSPIWGVGFQAYSDHAALNAHNALIQCMAETGLVGYMLWLSLLIINVYYLRQLLSSESEALLPPETIRMARLLALAFAGFVTTSWFLSRAYVQTLYLLLGLTVALHRIAASQNPEFKPMQLPQKTPVIIVSSALVSVVAFYFVVNLRN